MVPLRLMQAARFARTVVHLRPRQIADRITRRLPWPLPPQGVAAPPLRPAATTWQRCPGRHPDMVGPCRFDLLSLAADIAGPEDWDAPHLPKLWRYHLHYFDDLLADGAEGRAGWHRALISRWIEENSPVRGTGWEPYPLSRRIVNWAAWALAGHALDRAALDSLALQVRVLRGRLEYHLLGNHLLANAKALVFAGAFFDGPEAEAWLARGLAILEAEWAEQILPDGGHFELSPMYQALILEDLLDLMQLARIYPAALGEASRRQRWAARAAGMLAWLGAMSHPDGEIAYFNDAASGQARRPADLAAYAAALGVEGGSSRGPVWLRESGYLRLEGGGWTVLFDAAEIGPSYLPGHAHADTLSLELSLGAERIVANCGASTYEPGPLRESERATSAHATVEIDGRDSSEVWASFRVGRRAHPFGTRFERSGLGAEASHDGYRFLSGRPVHRRRVEIVEAGLRILDEVGGSGMHELTGRLPLHPAVAVEAADGEGWTLRTPLGRRIRVAVRGADALAVEEGHFAPRFGTRLPRPVLVWRKAARLPAAVTSEIAAIG